MDGIILVMDYSQLERSKIRKTLDNFGNFDFCEISNFEEYMQKRLKLNEIAAIIMDVGFPTSENGVELIKKLRKSTGGRNLPIIVTSKTDLLGLKSVLAKLGVSDFIVKPYPERRLVASLQSLVNVKRKYNYDLTGIPDINFSFSEFAERELKMAKRYGQPLTLIFLTPSSMLVNIMDEKSDKMAFIENLNRSISAKISPLIRETDTIAINNKTDIICLLPGANSKDTLKLFQKLKPVIQTALDEEGLKLEESLHCLYATFPKHGDTIEMLLKAISKIVAEREMMKKLSAIPMDTRNYAAQQYEHYNSFGWF